MPVATAASAYFMPRSSSRSNRVSVRCISRQYVVLFRSTDMSVLSSMYVISFVAMPSDLRREPTKARQNFQMCDSFGVLKLHFCSMVRLK